MNQVPLTVVSLDNHWVNPPSGIVSVFDTSRMSGLQANVNPTGATQSIPLPGGGSKVTAWSFTGLFNGKYSYSVTVSGTTVTFTLYNDPNMTNAIAQGSATIGASTTVIPISGLNDSLVKGTVTLNTSGSTATAESNAVIITGTENLSSLQVPGATQFEYRDLLEVKHKYTVLESLQDIWDLEALPLS